MPAYVRVWRELAILTSLYLSSMLALAQTSNELLSSRLQLRPRLSLQIESEVYRAAPGCADPLDPAAWETFPLDPGGVPLRTLHSIDLVWPAVHVESLASLPVFPGDSASVASAVSWVDGRAAQRYNRAAGPHYVISGELRRTEVYESLLLTLLDGGHALSAALGTGESRRRRSPA